jgi:hypothetical protein
MRKAKRPRIGSLVLLSRWSDHDIMDPWFIGFLCERGTDKQGMYYKAECERGETSRFFRHAFRITEREAAERFKESRLYE